MTITKPYTTAELDELTLSLRSSLASDVLDGMGLHGQALEPGLLPIVSGRAVVGYAYPTVADIVDAEPETPYIGLLDALDNIGLDEVWVCSSPSDAALWGELTSTAVRALGARGTVIDGYVRDVDTVRMLGYPVFARGTSPRDANGRVEQRRVSQIRMGPVSVSGGDLIVADDDGVVVIPAEHIVSVVTAALAKAADESLFRTAVREGMLPSDAFKKFGVL